MKLLLASVLIVSTALVLTGCREDEQNRPLSFEPGVYKGERTPPLTEQQRRELQERAIRMR